MESADDLIQQVRSGDYERFLAIQLARPEKRAALYALTAFAIELARVAEIVSEPLIGHIRLAWWREALEEIIAGKKPRSHPTVLALAEVYATTPATFAELFRMIDARATDLEPGALDEKSAWRDYLDGTAGALHSAWALVLDAQAAVTHADAIREQARAYATVGLLRAIPYLHAHGWNRFPRTRLDAFELESLAPCEALNRFVLATLEQALARSSSTSRSSLSLPKSLNALLSVAIFSYKYNLWLLKLQGDPYRLRPKKLGLAWEVMKINIRQRSCF